MIMTVILIITVFRVFNLFVFQQHTELYPFGLEHTETRLGRMGNPLTVA